MRISRAPGARWLYVCALSAALLCIGAAPADGAPGRSATPNELVARMSIEEKVGQLFVSRVYGDSADESEPGPVTANRKQLDVDNAAQLITRYHVGGIIYFGWAGNVDTPRAAARLSNGIQAAALQQAVPIPVLISTDQEGGSVTRLKSPATQFAGNMALGATQRTDLAREAGRVIGRELRATGIVQVLAPVADVNVNPANPVIGVRSYGSDPGLVADMTSAQVRGFEQDAGVAATAKHFPGHGDTDTDSHSGLPVIRHSLAEWRQIDAPPFKSAIAAGVDVIMTAHIAVPALDPSGRPATLSGPILTDTLRTEMGFDGVVITDSLGMGALRQNYTDRRIPVLALLAGADMLLNPPRIESAFDAVLDAVADGELSVARIDRSVERILALKERLGLFESPMVEVGQVGSVVGSTANRTVEKRVAEASITLVVNDDGLLPLPANPGSVLVTGSNEAAVKLLGKRLRARGVKAEAYYTGPSPGAAAISGAAGRAAGKDLIVVLTGNVDRSTAQRQLVAALNATDKDVISVAIGRPYDIAWYDAPTHLCLYSTSAASVRALVRVLFGDINPVGRLPVAITAANDPGTVLYPFGFGLGYP